jgi:hypothetical protein
MSVKLPEEGVITLRLEPSGSSDSSRQHGMNVQEFALHPIFLTFADQLLEQKFWRFWFGRKPPVGTFAKVFFFLDGLRMFINVCMRIWGLADPNSSEGGVSDGRLLYGLNTHGWYIIRAAIHIVVLIAAWRWHSRLRSTKAQDLEQVTHYQR